MASNHAIEYAYLVEQGIDGQPGLPKEALAFADTLIDTAEDPKDPKPTLSGILDVLAAEAWADLLGTEETDMANTITGRGDVIRDATERARRLVQANGVLPAEALHGIAAAVGVPATALLGSVPLLHAGQSEFRKITAALQESPEEARRYVQQATDGTLARILGYNDFSRGSIDRIEAMVTTLTATLGTQIPESIGLADLARAVATRRLLRNPVAMLNPTNTNQYQHEAAVFAQVAGMLDWNQAAGLSRTKAYYAEQAPHQ